MNAVTDYLRALREDLRDRRLLPLVVLAGVADVGAIAFVILGGSGGSSSSATASTGTSATPPTAAETTGLALTPVDTSNAVAETTDGAAVQHAGGSRDPFALLPNVASRPKPRPPPASTSTLRTPPAARPPAQLELGTALLGQRLLRQRSSGGESSDGSSKSGGSSGARARAATSGGSKPSKPKTVYQVSVLFGEAIAGSPSDRAPA